MGDTSASAIGAHFDKRAQTYASAAKWVNDPESLAPLATVVGEPSVRRVAEIGVGSGAVPTFLSTTGRLPLAYLGLDLSMEMLRSAEGWLRVRANAIHLPIRTGSVDVVMVRQAIHYFETPEEVLSEVRRFSFDPNGCLAIAQITPFDNAADVDWWKQAVDIRQPLRRHAWTESDLDELMRKAGFAVEVLPNVLGQSSLNSWLGRYPADELIATALDSHFRNAPIEVRRLRSMMTDENSDIRFGIKWSILLGRIGI